MLLLLLASPNAMDSGGTSTSFVRGGRRQVQTSFPDGSELVEEFDAASGRCLMRKRKAVSTIGRQAEWAWEIGEAPIARVGDSTPMVPSAENPAFARSDSGGDFVWRVRNLAYPKSTYSVTAEPGAMPAEGRIVIRTSNKKYFKKIEVPEMARLGLALDAAALSWEHSGTTLLVKYAKPEKVLKAEKKRVKDVAKAPAPASSGGAAAADAPPECNNQ